MKFGFKKGNRMRKVLAIFSPWIMSTAALASPVYLTCKISDGERVSEFQVTADEAVGSVSVFVPATGYSANMQAVFRPSELIFSDRLAAYKVDRVRLTITRKIGGLSGEDRGICVVEKQGKRAF